MDVVSFNGILIRSPPTTSVGIRGPGRLGVWLSRGDISGGLLKQWWRVGSA